MRLEEGKKMAEIITWRVELVVEDEHGSIATFVAIVDAKSDWTAIAKAGIQLGKSFRIKPDSVIAATSQSVN